MDIESLQSLWKIKLWLNVLKGCKQRLLVCNSKSRLTNYYNSIGRESYLIGIEVAFCKEYYGN